MPQEPIRQVRLGIPLQQKESVIRASKRRLCFVGVGSNEHLLDRIVVAIGGDHEVNVSILAVNFEGVINEDSDRILLLVSAVDLPLEQ